MRDRTETAPESSADSERQRPERCRNCGAILQGPHCHVCGQAAREVVRSFPAVARDFLDSVFEYDGRLWRTLGPLLVRPGHLSLEFLNGRRVRYVTPFRLFFFLTVIAFLAAQLRFSPDLDGAFTLDIGSASTVEEVEERRTAALAVLDAAVDSADAGEPSVARARAEIDAAGDRRIAELTSAAERGESPPRASSGLQVLFGDTAWDPRLNPIEVEWLPPAANSRLNAWLSRADINQRRIRQDPSLLSNAVLSSLPATLFVVVPIFALLLKMAYLFKRRLYMEHLIVALHTHAFFSFSLLLLIALSALSLLIADTPAARPLDWVERGIVLWMPFYVLVMQKRVYGQGWPMTLLKYSFLGVSYVVLLAFAVTINLLFNLVAL